MISDNVKKIFTFFEFLNSNIKNLNNQETILNEIERLRTEYNNLDPKIDFRNKFKREELEKKGNSLIESFKKECKNAINEKIIELDITDLNNFGNNHFHHIGELTLLIHTQKYELNDVDLILKAKCNYISILEHLEIKIENFIPYDLVKDLREDVLDCFKPFLSSEDKIIIEKKQFLFSSDNWFVLEKLDKENLEKVVRKLKGNSNKLHFETFPEFLDYFKKEVSNLDFDEQHSEVKSLIEQKRIKLENSTFQSEIDEVKIFSENAVKDFKHKLMLSFTNENYKTKYNSGLNPVVAFSKFYFDYQKLYNDAVSKNLHLEALPPQKQQKAEQKENNLAEMITHENSIIIVEKIKIQYKNIKGKRLKLLLMAMQELNLLPQDRIAQMFHNCCEAEFDWDIASYNAMNGYVFNKNVDNVEFSEMKQFISNIVNAN